MKYLQLHPKVKAAAWAAGTVIAATLGAYFKGEVSGGAVIGVLIAGLTPVLAGYLKSGNGA